MPTLSLPLLTCAAALLTTACSMLSSDRVEQARANQEPNLRRLCKEKGLNYPLKRMFIRAFKEEKTLEVWGSNGEPTLKLVKTYAVAKQSGVPGPKRKEGDKQVPEGAYVVDRFNPKSIGCLAMTDPLIEEIYLLALGAKAQGIPVHIFPCRMKGPLYIELKRMSPEHREFWAELEPIFSAFEKTQLVPKVKVSKLGEYSL